MERVGTASAAPTSGQTKNLPYFTIRIVPLVLLVGAIVWGAERFIPRTGNSGDADAITACQLAVRGVATNPSSANIPYRKPLESGGAYLVSWPVGAGLQLQNSLGALIDASASCIYNVSVGRVTALSVNGKSVL